MLSLQTWQKQTRPAFELMDVGHKEIGIFMFNEIEMKIELIRYIKLLTSHWLKSLLDVFYIILCIFSRYTEFNYKFLFSANILLKEGTFPERFNISIVTPY